MDKYKLDREYQEAKREKERLEESVRVRKNDLTAAERAFENAKRAHDDAKRARDEKQQLLNNAQSELTKLNNQFASMEADLKRLRERP